MLAKKHFAIAVILGMVSSGLFANDLMGSYFDGDKLNDRIRTYIGNVSKLIPDSTTLQNVWSYVPDGDYYFGVGINGSITLLEQRLASRVVDGASSFGGSHNDLSNFPEAIPFLPGMAFDIRFGVNRLEFGICGMWMDEAILAEQFGTSFLGENSHFNYRSLGLDVRYTVLSQSDFIPAITLQAGYYFTWMGFGISAGSTEKVTTDFRNDSILLSVQASKDLMELFTPYVGFKAIFSKTDSAFSWETHRPVMINGTPYLEGARYESGATEGEFYTYLQVYGGVGISFLFPHLVTIGGAYNIITNHFCINAAVRLVFNF